MTTTTTTTTGDDREPFNPTRIVVTGTVPISVVVDLETGEVERVVVEDDRSSWDSPPTGWDQDTTGNPTDEHFAKAIALADDAIWPAWQFGW